MLDWNEWQLDTCHGGNFSSPQTGCIDHVLGMNRALVSIHIP